MDSNEDLDFNDEFEEVDDNQNEDEGNQDLDFGSDDENDQQKQSDYEDNLYFDDNQKDKQKKKSNKVLIDDFDDNDDNEGNNNKVNEMENEELDFLDTFDNTQHIQKNERENFLNLVKNTGDDDILNILLEESHQVGKSATGEANPHLIKEQMILDRMLEKQKKYNEIMYEKEKLEFLKKTRKIRQNPEEYRNFIKCFVLCEVSSTFYFLKYHLDDPLLKAMVLSQFSSKDLNFLLSMRNQPEKYTTKSIIRTVNYHIQQYFVYKWKKEQIDIFQNLEAGVEVGYSQMTIIAMIIFEYIGLRVRYTKIVDLRYLNLDKKHNSRIKENKRNSNQSQDSNSGNKRKSRESIVSNIVAAKKATRFSNMASRIADNLMNQSTIEQSESDYSDDDDDEEKMKKKQTQKDNVEFFDSFMANFKFDKKTQGKSSNNASVSKKNQNEEDSLLSTASSNLQNTDSNKFDYRKYLRKGQNDQPKSSTSSVNKTQLKEEEEMCLVKTKIEQLNTIDKKEGGSFNNEEEDDDEQQEILNPFSFAYSKKKFKTTQQSMIQTQQSSSQNSQTENKQQQQQQKQEQTQQQQQDTNGETQTQKSSYKSDFYQSAEIKYWLEVYDDKNNNWISFDAVQNEILEKFQILMKQHGMPVLFVVGYNLLEFKNQNLSQYINEKRSMKNRFLFDLTDVHTDRYLKILISRKELNFDYWWRNLLQHVSFLGNPDHLQEEYKQQIISERTMKQNMQKLQLPQSYPEFRVSEIFITKSMLQKYQGLHPNAIKTGLLFKDEDVYYREYVVDLHARTRWRSMRRAVKPGEVPVKQVQSILGNQKMVDLFGEWQTEDLIHRIGQDGTLPRNEYGNWETFAGEPPEGTVLIELQGLPKLLKKHNIEYVEAVTGFESSSSGRSHVVKNGILAHSRDEQRIRQLYLENYEIMKAQQAENLKKELMGLWRKVFKGVLLKKSITDRINKIHM